jgi:hypothetical protein
MTRLPLRSKRSIRVMASMALVAASLVTAATSSSSTPVAAADTDSGCQLDHGVKHVIHITFDNVHFFRDNPNVPSDVEQMPTLLNFIQGNGTMLSNEHTPLIAHTADDLLTQFSGLYGDRHGMGVTNSYEYYNGPAVKSADSFVYWTSPIIDHASQTPSTTDLNPSMVYSADVPPAPVASSTGNDAMAPAPWATYTKAGCTVGDFSTANMVLEKFADIPTVFGAGSPESQQLAADTGDAFKDAEIDDYIGMSIHCGQTKGVNDPLCTSASAVKYNQTTATPTAVPEVLPDEPGGYDNFVAVHGSRYITPVIGGGANVVHNGSQVTDADGNLVDLDGHTIVGGFKDKRPPFTAPTTTFNPGFPGFSPTASQSLAYIADMQEAGIPVTYAYISDAHDKKTPNGSTSRQVCPGNPGNALGPADTCFKDNLAAYDASFKKFFDRLAADGITKQNTLFVFSSEENDHYAGSNVGLALQPACTGTPRTLGYTCTYTNATGTSPVGEVQLNVHTLLANEKSNTTPFYSEPQGVAIYATGGPSTDTVRQLERDFGSVTANNPYVANANDHVVRYMADPLTEQLLHFTNADPNRTPTFTLFPKGEYFFSGGLTDTCPGVTPANANTTCSSINTGFAYNHGYYAPEIDITWLGMVGPGISNRGLDGPPATFRPDPTKSVPANSTVGTWSDHTDIRPTMFALLGLKDPYVGDGRVLTEILKNGSEHGLDGAGHDLAVCYKQLNSSVGRFGTAVLIADTAALNSGSTGSDAQYATFSATLAQLGAQRDALATKIKQDLSTGQHGDDLHVARSDLADCNSIISQAEALANIQPTG